MSSEACDASETITRQRFSTDSSSWRVLFRKANDRIWIFPIQSATFRSELILEIWLEMQLSWDRGRCCWSLEGGVEMGRE